MHIHIRPNDKVYYAVLKASLKRKEIEYFENCAYRGKVTRTMMEKWTYKYGNKIAEAVK